MNSKRHLVEQALALLGIDRLALAIHDQSFPSLPEEELGRGTPYSLGSRQFFRFISESGFNAVQLGPQGRTTFSNPSPYDSSLFSKNELSISLNALAEDPDWGALVDRNLLAEVVKESPAAHRVRSYPTYQYSWNAQHKVLNQVFEKFSTQADQLKHLWLAIVVWSEQQSHWLVRDAVFEALSTEYGTDDWLQWNREDQQLWVNSSNGDEQSLKRLAEVRTTHAKTIDYYKFCQYLAHRQHEQLRALVGSLAVKLYADMQIGFSTRDMWSLRPLFLSGYLLGAPPSRTNPNGQPWGYPFFNPELYFDGTGETDESHYGPALTGFVKRIDKLLLDFDSLRIDHPHGIVCPWIYKSNDPNALHAVQTGSRLFESPNSQEHPELSKYAIVQPDQLAENEGVERYADAWVKSLTDAQVKQYGLLFEVIKRRMLAHGKQPSDLICEVLSSCPYPLRRVLQKNNLGRFRVTQKAKPGDPQDVYRSDNARAEDWIMLGTHDTKPIWAVIEEMSAEDKLAWGHYLAGRLQPNDADKAERLQPNDADKAERLQPDDADHPAYVARIADYAARIAADNGALAEAMFADLFIGPARNVSVFFSDLFGIKKLYNEPGIISDTNWLLSVPANFEAEYKESVERKTALSVSRALATALRAKLHSSPEALKLATELEQLSAQAVYQ